MEVADIYAVIWWRRERTDFPNDEASPFCRLTRELVEGQKSG